MQIANMIHERRRGKIKDTVNLAMSSGGIWRFRDVWRFRISPEATCEL